jgi:hypothetical protein
MKKLFLGIMTATLATAALPAYGALMINNADITAGGTEYKYDLSFAELTSTNFNNDVFTKSNVEVVAAGSGTSERRFVRTVSGQTSAEFVYKFDFTNTDYRPTSLDLTDVLFVFGVNAADGQTLTGTTAYSLDGTTYNQIRTLSSSKTSNPQNPNSGPGVTTIALPTQPGVVYYKFTGSVSSGTFPQDAVHWNRMGPSDATRFIADFTVAAVPEPSAAALMLGAGALFLRRRSTSLK